jgi:nucleoside-diphosphate-sugar epimerase
VRIFVTGATGVLGRRALPLLAAHHTVTAVARSEEKAAAVQNAGATAVRLDLFDPDAVRRAVDGHECVVNLATHIPDLAHLMLPSAWRENSRVRTAVSRNLVDAALTTGAVRVVQESITMMYRDGGDQWLDESTPFDDRAAATGPVQIAEAQAARVTAAGGAGVVLRFALFYGSGASHTESQLRLARRGLAPVVGSPTSYLSHCHLDDAARAVAAALTAPAGVYNVAESASSTITELRAAMAAAVGRRRLVRAPMPRALVPASTRYVVASLRVSSRAFVAATEWTPTYPSAREGWAEVASHAP